jgi:hypothetical protein
MTLAKFIKEYGYDTDMWATECFIASGEFDREYQAWAEKHGDPNDNWGEFSKHLWSEESNESNSSAEENCK